MIVRLFFCLMTLVFVLQCGQAIAFIKLKTIINGKQAVFLVDTKSKSTVLFAHAAERIGLAWTPAEQAPAEGYVAAGKSEVCKFNTGGGPRPFVFAVVDLPQYQKMAIDGVLAWDGLQGNILFFDGEQRQFSAIEAIPDFAKGWQKFPLKKGAGSLVIKTEDTDILIETGNKAGLQLGAALWERWISQHEGAPYTLKAYATPQNAVVVDKVYHAEHFGLAGFDLKDVLLERDRNQEDAEYDISLGLGALSYVNVIVDGPNGVAYVNQPEVFPPAPDYNRLGAVFVPEDAE